MCVSVCKCTCTYTNKPECHYTSVTFAIYFFYFCLFFFRYINSIIVFIIATAWLLCTDCCSTADWLMQRLSLKCHRRSIKNWFFFAFFFIKRLFASQRDSLYYNAMFVNVPRIFNTKLNTQIWQEHGFFETWCCYSCCSNISRIILGILVELTRRVSGWN